MRTASERAKVRRNVCLEFLEDRNLLSLFSPKSLAGEVSAPTPITTIVGHLQGLPATAGLYTPTHPRTLTSPGFHSYSGHGSARPVGNVLFSMQQVETTTGGGTGVSIKSGSGQLYDYKGNELFLAYTGTGQVPDRGPVTINLSGNVISGTRRFHNDAGTFTATGTYVRATGRLNLAFTITLKHKLTVLQ